MIYDFISTACLRLQGNFHAGSIATETWAYRVRWCQPHASVSVPLSMLNPAQRAQRLATIEWLLPADRIFERLNKDQEKEKEGLSA